MKINWKDVTLGGNTFNSRMFKGLVYSARLQAMGFSEGPMYYNDELISADDVDWIGIKEALDLLDYYDVMDTGYEVFPPGVYTVEKFQAALLDYDENKEKYLEEMRIAKEEGERLAQIEEDYENNSAL